MQPPPLSRGGEGCANKQFREVSKARAQIKYGPVAQQIVEYLTRQRPSRKTYAGVPGENRFYNEAERQLAQSEGRQPVKGNFEKRIPSSPIGLGMKVEVK